MILYLDTSALVKRYVRERGSMEVIDLVDRADLVGSAILTYVEMAAALARAERLGWVAQNEAGTAWDDFQVHWQFFSRLVMSSGVVDRAARLARRFGLRGYDAIHLSSALGWQDGLGAQVALATFDQQLWTAAANSGMSTWPEKL